MKSLILRHWESYFLGQFMVATVLVVFGYTPMMVAVSVLGIVNLWMMLALALTYAIDKLYKWWKEKAVIIETNDVKEDYIPKQEYKDTDLKDTIEKARKTVISPEDPTEVTEEATI